MQGCGTGGTDTSHWGHHWVRHDQSDLFSPWVSPALHHVHRKTATLPVGVLDPFSSFFSSRDPAYSMHRRQMSHPLV